VQIEQQNKNKSNANIQICHLNKYESDQVYEEAKAMERKEKSKKIKTRAEGKTLTNKKVKKKSQEIGM